MAIFIVAVFCLIISLVVYVLVDASLFGGDKVTQEAMKKHKSTIEREKRMREIDKLTRQKQELIQKELKVKERRFQESSYKYES